MEGGLHGRALVGRRAGTGGRGKEKGREKEVEIWVGGGPGRGVVVLVGEGGDHGACSALARDQEAL